MLILYRFFSTFPENIAFATAVLLTPIALAAAVKLLYSVSTRVLIFLTRTDTPIEDVIVSDIFSFVSFGSTIPVRFLDIFSFVSSLNILPVAAKDKFFLVYSLCLNPNDEPAFSNTLYSGFSKSK